MFTIYIYFFKFSKHFKKVDSLVVNLYSDRVDNRIEAKNN